MQEITKTERAERFMPDWIVGAALRWSLIPGLWVWGRAYAADWPDVVPSAVSAAQIWAVPLVAPAQLAQIAVWGAHLAVVMLAVGFLTRIVGLALLIAAIVFAWWIAPQAWTSAAVYGALAFYLCVRGGGGLSVDGAVMGALR
ncbi:DoxX family membrane protein [Maricaulis salignorans]|uniref:DoxX protein n=1 Tax=Maricaulis salignorans TaxID=144026 RepID=A0A1G9LJM2_9PROT|nr:DoxX family membrane protein [Maricaulis salignorans]SDL62084.1 DoxX protein [Maricaulis salignorans]